jgi:hypothetical protein
MVVLGGDAPALGGLRGGDERPDVDRLDRAAVDEARADAAVHELIAGEQAFVQGARLPMFVGSRPCRIRWTISPSWSRSPATTGYPAAQPSWL